MKITEDVRKYAAEQGIAVKRFALQRYFALGNMKPGLASRREFVRDVMSSIKIRQPGLAWPRSFAFRIFIMEIGCHMNGGPGKDHVSYL